ncbi:hypothetical protein C0995_001845 [Termitomyces sp. Mi166|nr:hypothetical protein C0995_001845 [Termitomyces sp. Mi166\
MILTVFAAAYFSQQRLDELGTIDEIPGVGDVQVPEGLFRSARAGKMRRDHRSSDEKIVSPADHDISSLAENSGVQFEDDETGVDTVLPELASWRVSNSANRPCTAGIPPKYLRPSTKSGGRTTIAAFFVADDQLHFLNLFKLLDH